MFQETNYLENFVRLFTNTSATNSAAIVSGHVVTKISQGLSEPFHTYCLTWYLADSKYLIDVKNQSMLWTGLECGASRKRDTELDLLCKLGSKFVCSAFTTYL